MEGILALMIPVLAMTIGLVHAIKRPARGGGRGHELDASRRMAALEGEVALLREELAQARERVDFTERLLMGAEPATRLARPAHAEAALRA